MRPLSEGLLRGELLSCLLVSAARAAPREMVSLDYTLGRARELMRRLNRSLHLTWPGVAAEEHGVVAAGQPRK
jgi:hypothetical protein